MTILKPFNYKLLEVYPLSDIKKFKNHRRLQTFFHKGFKCVSCQVEGVQLCLGMSNNGSKHVDVYTEDFQGLTVDHIIPKSKGGPNHLDNFQPMCAKCNTKKGNGEPSKKNVSIKERLKCWRIENSEIQIKDILYKRGKKKNTFYILGTVLKFENNPHFNNEYSIVFEEKPGSYYSFTKKFYVKV